MSAYRFGSPTDPIYDENGYIIEDPNQQTQQGHSHRHHHHHHHHHGTNSPGGSRSSSGSGINIHLQLQNQKPKKITTAFATGSLSSSRLDDGETGLMIGPKNQVEIQTLEPEPEIEGADAAQGDESGAVDAEILDKKRAVIKIRGGTKRYYCSGRNRRMVKILTKFSMTVEEGTIYTLLGANGGGKSTLISCILGLKRLDKGEVSVFGKKPGSTEAIGRIGYVPQKLGLYPFFTINETLYYAGSLYGMGTEDIKSRIDFLTSFLGLPVLTKNHKERTIQMLRSGHKKLVSFAVALMHSPQLLILDEVTVGLDPLLWERLWSNLTHLLAEEGSKLTILLTSNSPCDARSSNTVGLLRNGHLVEENDPLTLLKNYDAIQLEQVWLKLCRQDHDKMVEKKKHHALHTSESDSSLIAVMSMTMSISIMSASTNNSSSGDEEIEKNLQQVVTQEEPEECWALREARDSIISWKSNKETNSAQDSVKNKKFLCGCSRFRAVCSSRFFNMGRNCGLILFLILTPVLLLLLLCNGIGNGPRSISLGVVNHEVSSFSKCDEYLSWTSGNDGNGGNLIKQGCDMRHLSCKYLDHIPKESSIKLKEYDSESNAQRGIELGEVWGYLSFPQDFSDAIVHRIMGGGGGIGMNDELLTSSFITYQLDTTNKPISGYLREKLSDIYDDLMTSMLDNCGFNAKLGNRPVKPMKPFYGSNDTQLVEYIAPGCLIGFLFFFPMIITSLFYIMDRKQGTLARARVAGVTTNDILASYCIVEIGFIGIILGLGLGIFWALFGFPFPYQAQGGAVPILVAIYLLVGLGGVCAGVLLGSVCSSEGQAVLITMMLSFPNWLLSGIFWPLESWQYPIQYMSYGLPCTLPAEAVRSIISRGLSWDSFHVYPGIIMALGWTTLLWILTLVVNKYWVLRR